MEVSKIVFVVSNSKIENHTLHLINNLLSTDTNFTVTVFVKDDISYPDNYYLFKLLKRIDIRFKGIKESAFEKKSIYSIQNSRFRITKSWSDIEKCDWMICNHSTDTSLYKDKVKFGFLATGSNEYYINESFFSKKNKIDVKFMIKLKGKEQWEVISNLDFSKEIGLTTNLEKFHWFLQLSIFKFLNNSNQYTQVANFSKNTVKYFTYRICKYYLNLIWKIFKRKFFGKNFNWKIAFKDQNNKLAWLKQPERSFWADPFLVQEENYKFLFIEEYNYSTRLGEIACIHIDENYDIIEKKTVLKSDSHLSFPNVFKYEGRYFMLPENSEINQLNIYEATSFPFEWKFSMTLIDNIKLLDVVWIYSDGYYWLLGNMIQTYEYENNDCLFLYYSTNLLSNTWIAHKQNPIIIDSSKARNAGDIFMRNGKLYRPSQNCSDLYGGNIVINEILELSTEKYSEKEVEVIYPEKGYHGIHTMNTLGDLSVFDYLKYE